MRLGVARAARIDKNAEKAKNQLIQWGAHLEGVANFSKHFPAGSLVKPISFHWVSVDSGSPVLTFLLEGSPSFRIIFFEGNSYRIWFPWHYFTVELSPSPYQYGPCVHIAYLDFAWKRLDLSNQPWTQVFQPWLSNTYENGNLCLPNEAVMIDDYWEGKRDCALANLLENFIEVYYSSDYNSDVELEDMRARGFHWLNEDPALHLKMLAKKKLLTVSRYGDYDDDEHNEHDDMYEVLHDKPASFYRKIIPLIDAQAKPQWYGKPVIGDYQKRLEPFKERMTVREIQTALQKVLINLKDYITIAQSMKSKAVA